MKKLFKMLNTKFKKAVFGVASVGLAVCMGMGVFAVVNNFSNNQSQIVSQEPSKEVDLPVELNPQEPSKDTYPEDQNQGTLGGDKPAASQGVTSNTALNNGYGLFKTNFTRKVKREHLAGTERLYPSESATNVFQAGTRVRAYVIMQGVSNVSVALNDQDLVLGTDYTVQNRNGIAIVEVDYIVKGTESFLGEKSYLDINYTGIITNFNVNYFWVYTSLQNRLTFTCAGGWEILGQKLAVEQNKTYTLTFAVDAPSFPYNYQGFPIMVLSSAPNDGVCQSQMLARSYILSGKSQSVTLTFNSENFSTVWIVLNGGYIADGSSYTFLFKNFVTDIADFCGNMATWTRYFYPDRFDVLPQNPYYSHATSAGQLICTISGRQYKKVNEGFAYTALVNNGGSWLGPMLVSTDKDAVTYTTSQDSSVFTASGSVYYLGKTWYYAGRSYYMGAAGAVAKDFNGKIYNINLNDWTSAVLALLHDTGIYYDNYIYTHASAAGELICTVGGRQYKKVNEGFAYTALVNNGGSWLGPMLVSIDKDAVTYTTSQDSSVFTALGSVEYMGQTWYYAGQKYYMGADATVSNFNGKKYSIELGDWNTAVRSLLDDVYAIYTSLQYIESSGTQYINTKTTANSNVKVEAVAAYTSTSGVQMLFGAQNANDSNRSFMIGKAASENTNFYAYYNYLYKQVKEVSSTEFLNKHTYTLDKNKVYYDGSLVKTFEETSFDTRTSIYVFGVSKTGVHTFQASAKLYTMKIWSNGTLVRDFTPVSRHSDGVVGLYDHVSNQFFVNSGSGEFLYA